MTYATVMVSQLALNRSNAARLEIAGQLVKRFNACAIGIAAGEFSPPLYFTTGEQAQKVLDQGQAAIRNRVAEVEAQFRAAIQNRAAAAEWRCAEDFPTRFAVQQARAANIIVVGVGGGEALADPFTGTNPNDLVMQLGRPVLDIPDLLKLAGFAKYPDCLEGYARGAAPLSSTHCRCFGKPKMSPSSKLSRTMPAGRRHCQGSRTSSRGCHAAECLPPSRCPANAAKPPRKSK